MLAATVALPDRPADWPPIVLIHGAANSALVWSSWQRALAESGWASYAVDLRGHGRSDACDLSRVSMHDYADDVVGVARQFAKPPVVMGWSMGGLVAMMVAAATPVAACVGLAPSTPAAERDPSVPLRAGEFGPEEYGITTDDPASLDTPMPDLDHDERRIAIASLGPESRYARDERAAGVVVEPLACPLLIVTGTADMQWPRARYDTLHLPAEHRTAESASHWGLVLNRRALATLAPSVVEWLQRVTAQ